MIYGTPLNGNNKNGSWYNVGDDDTQLPLFRLDPDEVTNHRDFSFWLRDIASALSFTHVNINGCASWPVASSPWAGVRAFFLIG